jgi:8-oxo-dGTP diphosphatase
VATPRVVAGVLFRDPDDRVLLVKPSRKAGWDIPGGYVEPGESPKRAVSREELGIEPPIGRLLVVDRAPHPKEGDKVLFIFGGGELSNGNLSPAAPDEIEEVKFSDDTDRPDLMPQRLLDRLASALRVDEGDTYLEPGTRSDS